MFTRRDTRDSSAAAMAAKLVECGIAIAQLTARIETVVAERDAAQQQLVEYHQSIAASRASRQ